MSNKNRRKKQNHDEVFMQICNNQNGEEYMLKVPENYKHVLNGLMSGKECTDYHNSQEMLQFFASYFQNLIIRNVATLRYCSIAKWQRRGRFRIL